MNAVLYAFVVGLHILICFILIVVVLLQTGKGDSGALLGGSSQTVFGSRGPTTFFHYLTGGSAGLFLVTSLFLSCAPRPGTGPGDTVLPDEPGVEDSALPGEDGSMAPDDADMAPDGDAGAMPDGAEPATSGTAQ